MRGGTGEEGPRSYGQPLTLQGASERREARGDSVRWQVPAPCPRRSSRTLRRGGTGAQEAEDPIALRLFVRVVDAWPRGTKLAVEGALGALGSARRRLAGAVDEGWRASRAARVARGDECHHNGAGNRGARCELTNAPAAGSLRHLRPGTVRVRPPPPMEYPAGRPVRALNTLKYAKAWASGWRW